LNGSIVHVTSHLNTIFNLNEMPHTDRVEETNMGVREIKLKETKTYFDIRYKVKIDNLISDTK